MHPGLIRLLSNQDALVTRRQALQFMTQAEITSRLGKIWQVVLPGVYASFTGTLTDRHRARAALLLAGEEAMLNDATALKAHRVDNLPVESFQRVLVPDQIQVSSREFVVVRRTKRLPVPLQIAGLPTAPVARAVCEFVARHPDEREAFAVMCAAVQQNRVSMQQLAVEIEQGPNRGKARLMRLYGELEAGVRSVSEGDFRRLVRTSKIVPEPKWNWLIELPGGERISPDGMILEAALIHEVNGRRYHSAELAGEDAFMDMQKRADLATTAGFTVLQNAARRIDIEGDQVLREFETCFLRTNGVGLPPGVRILRAGPPGWTPPLSATA